MKRAAPLWGLALVTLVVCFVAFARTPHSLEVPFVTVLAQALAAPIVWIAFRPRAPVTVVPGTLLATHAALFTALLIHARSMPRETPDGVRVRGEGLAIVIAVHPFFAVALALSALAIAALFGLVAKRIEVRSGS